MRQPLSDGSKNILKTLTFCVSCILHIQHMLPTNAHRIYKILKHKIHKNIVTS